MYLHYLHRARRESGSHIDYSHLVQPSHLLTDKPNLIVPIHFLSTRTTTDWPVLPFSVRLRTHPRRLACPPRPFSHHHRLFMPLQLVPLHDRRYRSAPPRPEAIPTSQANSALACPHHYRLLSPDPFASYPPPTCGPGPFLFTTDRPILSFSCHSCPTPTLQDAPHQHSSPPTYLCASYQAVPYPLRLPSTFPARTALFSSCLSNPLPTDRFAPRLPNPLPTLQPFPLRPNSHRQAIPGLSSPIQHRRTGPIRPSSSHHRRAMSCRINPCHNTTDKPHLTNSFLAITDLPSRALPLLLAPPPTVLLSHCQPFSDHHRQACSSRFSPARTTTDESHLPVPARHRQSKKFSYERK